MSDQLLIPFKAKFVLTVNTTMKNFFEDSNKVSLEEKYKPITDELGNVDVAKFINYYHLSSNTYNNYKQFDFKFHQAFDVHQSNLGINDRDFPLHFKLESFQVEVLQITNSGKEILFSDSSNKLKTVLLDDDLELFKV
jgi:hypothetical protein